MDRWFVSDHHLSHYNIIKFSNRPFQDCVEMDKFLLEIHNQYVKPEDHVYFLGDVTLKRGGRQDKEWFINEIRRYHGHKTLFLGNHDHFPTRTYLDAGFEKIRATWRDEANLLYSHIPIHPDNLGYGVKANVHGHIHTNPSPKPVLGVDRNGKVYVVPYINVSVEATNYRPINLDEVLERVEKAIKEVG